MKVSEKKKGIQDSIANMKSSPITKSQTKMTMNYYNVEFMKLADFICLSSGCTTPLDLVIEHKFNII